MSKNFIDYENGYQIFESISSSINALKGAYVIRGNSTFENLPSVLTTAMNGYVYNVTNAFVTDNRFVEGAGKSCEPGTNVVIVDLSTYNTVSPVGSENPTTEGWYELVEGKYILSTDTEVDDQKTYYEKDEVIKFDVSGQFVDLDKLNSDIKSVQDMITDEFVDTHAYKSGDVVIFNKKLYQVSADYNPFEAVTPEGSENPAEEGWYERSGESEPYTYTITEDTTVDGSKTYYSVNGWDDVSKTQTTVAQLIDAAEPDSLTTQQINSILALFD